LNSQKQNYNFYVDRYQTPFATIDIKTLEFRTFLDPIVPININCFYTFGKPVTGLATILITKTEECGNKMLNTTQWSKNFNISGQLDEKIDFRDTKLLNPNCESKFNLTAIIIDNITKQKYFNYKMIEFHKQSIIAKNLNPLQKIKPGLSFRVFIKFLNIEGNEVDVNKLNKLDFEAQLVLNNNATKITNPMHVVKKYNNMVLEFKTEPLTKLLKLKLKLGDTLIDEYTYYSYTSCKQTLIQVGLQEPLRKLNVGESVNLIVTGTEAIDYLSYYLLVKGDIVNSSSLVFTAPDSAVVLPISLKKEMAPDVTVVIYYYSKTTGILSFDSLNLQIDGLFENNVKIKVENTTLDVSRVANFSIQTQPDSQLLLLSVDQAVVRENMNSFITENSVINQLRDIQETKNVANGDITSSINFGSNAIPQCSTYYNLEITDTIDETDPESKVRSDYRKTWIWDRTYV